MKLVIILCLVASSLVVSTNAECKATKEFLMKGVRLLIKYGMLGMTQGEAQKLDIPATFKVLISGMEAAYPKVPPMYKPKLAKYLQLAKQQQKECGYA